MQVTNKARRLRSIRWNVSVIDRVVDETSSILRIECRFADILKSNAMNDEPERERMSQNGTDNIRLYSDAHANGTGCLEAAG